MLLILLLIFSDLPAQRTLLMLQTRSEHRNAYYEVGDELTFYIKDRKSRIKDRIISLEDSTVVFRGYQVPINQITALHIDNKTRWWLRFKPAQLLLLGGTGYIVIDAINSGEFDEGTLAVGGSLIGLGLIFKLLIPNKIRLKGRTRLRILTI